MFTERLTKKPKGSQVKGRKAVVWAGTIGVGFVAFLATLFLRGALERSPSNPLAAPQGVVYDQAMTQFARQWQASHQSGPITVISIKESTSSDLGVIPSFIPGVPGPFNFQDHARAYHARLLQNLKTLGAKTVVFDLVFADPNPKLDGALAAAIKDHGNVILAGVVDSNQENSGGGTSTKLLLPNSEIRAGAKGIGIANVGLDAVDKTARTFTWWFPGMDEETAEDMLYPCLGAAAAAAHSGKDPRKIMLEEVKPNRTFLGKPVIGEPRGGSADAPIDSRMRYYGQKNFPSGQSSEINYENVLRRGQDEAALNRLREQINGKIVIIGDLRKLSQDEHKVPVISRTAQGTEPLMAGVEIQAHITQSTLNGEYIRKAGEGGTIALIFVVCMLVAVMGRLLNPNLTVGITVLMVAGLFFGSVQLMASQGLFQEPVYASVGAVSALILETGFMYFAERRDRERVRRQLTRHVGKGVADTLADDEWPELSGESREITMLFSDLQGFTSLSETMSSQEICALLNRYFGVVFPIVDKYHGTVDKLMGDGMMAYFGFPKRRPGHAREAIECAVEIQKELEAWTRQPENAGLPPLRTRVGIHTGVATIGEVGAGDRVEFSVIGDVVNIASRLEGMNKDFGTIILISENTRDAAGEIAPMTYRGVATVRGRKEPTPVYSVDVAMQTTGRHRTSTRSASMRVPTTGEQQDGETSEQ